MKRGKNGESRLRLRLATGIQNVKFQSKRGSGRRYILRKACGAGIDGINEQRHRSRVRHQLVRQLKPLRPELDIQLGYPGDVSARMTEAGDEANTHRIAGGGEYDRDGLGSRLADQICRRAGRGENCDLTADEIGCEIR